LKNKIALNNKNNKLTIFKEINSISPYQLNICGSNLKSVRDEFASEEDIKIQIFHTKKIEKEIDPLNLFMLIRDGIKWFSNLFGLHFPYNKIDIVYLREYKNVANSFPGATIIIDERYFYKCCDNIDKNYFNIILINQM